MLRAFKSHQTEQARGLMRGCLARTTVAAGLCSVFVAASAATQSQFENDQPSVEMPLQAKKPIGFVPKGWVMDRKIKADLNHDGRPDLVFVLRLNNPANVWHDQSHLKRPPVDTNPRWLGIALAKGSGYVLLTSSKTLIPPASVDSLSEPLVDMSIERGALHLEFESFPTIGSGHVSNTRMTFRLTPHCIRLVSFDDHHFHRYAAERLRLHVDFQRGQQWKYRAATEGAAYQRTEEKAVQYKPICVEHVGNALSFHQRLIDLKEFS